MSDELRAAMQRINARVANVEEHLITCAQLIETQVRLSDRWADEWRAKMNQLTEAQAQTQRQLDHLSSVVHRHATDPDAHR